MNMRLVGILNLTPDSFSDGGAHGDTAAAIAALEAMTEAGAAAVDVGAESTRPGASPVSPAEEWMRLEPFFLNVWPRFRGTGLRLSVDTRHPATAARALDCGADWLNDVSGFACDGMAEAVAKSDATLVVMHSLTVPADPAVTLPQGEDVIGVLLRFARARLHTLAGYGIDPSRVIFDPGIGFGKTAAQSLEIIRRMAELKPLGVKLLVGHSRKSFLRQFGDREAATLTVSYFLAQAGIDYLRVHDVPAHAAMLRAQDALA